MDDLGNLDKKDIEGICKILDCDSFIVIAQVRHKDGTVNIKTCIHTLNMLEALGLLEIESNTLIQSATESGNINKAPKIYDDKMFR